MIRIPSKNDHGFTLVELAIALMVIGLLIGGVLKGQELIENARVTALVRQFKAYDAAVMIFRNTYGAYPGDIKKPTRIPNCTAEMCSMAGNGNGRVAMDSTDPEGEEFNFFPHMTKAGMIQGPEGGTAEEKDASRSSISGPESDLFYPSTPFDMIMRMRAINSTGTNPVVQNSYIVPHDTLADENGIALPTRAMQAIDSKIDDGMPYKGDVHVYEIGSCPTISYPDGEYDLEATGPFQCSLAVPATF